MTRNYRLAENYTSIIRNLGEDVNREGISSTPVEAAHENAELDQLSCHVG
jgi:GTP cyclohydrolase I